MTLSSIRVAPILTFCASWPRTATTVRATLTPWSRNAWRACAIRQARASRTARRMAGVIGSSAVARQPAARSR
jgi:hypothetical protein